MTRPLVLGLGLTALVSLAAGAVWGGEALPGATGFGLLAVALHLGSVVMIRPALRKPWGVFIRRWATGMGLRLLGIVVFAVAVGVGPQVFQPLPSALGYVGVLVPLLFAETRYLQ